MKKTVLLSLAVLLAVVAARADVTINSTNFPDANFRSYLLSEYPSGTITTAQLQARTTLEVNNMSISNMKGVEYFTELTRLSCYMNNLTTIDVSSNTKLTYLNLYRNKLTSINVNNNTALEQLYLHYNQLTLVSVSNHSALRTLWVNQNPDLKTLNCWRNALTNVDVTGCTSLDALRCYENPSLSTINGLADCTALTYLDCEDCYFRDLSALSGMSGLKTLLARNNKLTSLDVSNKLSLTTLRLYGNTLLTTLNCDLCALSSLDITSCSALTSLICSNNTNLATITGLSSCTALKELVCYSCALTDVSAVNSFSNIERVVCSDNNITQLTVTNKTKLWQLAVDDNLQLTELNVSNCSALTILNVTGCTALSSMYCFNNNQLAEITGLTDCKAMVTLYCYNNALTSLNFSGFTNLVKLSCTGNKLTYLNLYGCSALTDLRCYFNYNLQYINNLSSCKALTYIDCEDCAIYSLSGLLTLQNLTHIYAGNNDLTSFSYYGNIAEDLRLPLTTLRLSGNENLTELVCYYTNLSALDVSSGCTALENLNCRSNKLASLDLRTLSSLKSLNCNDNQLTELDISHCTALELLWCNQNQLSSLDLSNCPDTFFSLDCRYNNIGHALDMSRFAQLYQLALNENQIPQLTLGTHADLTDIWCASNLLTSLDVSGCPALKRLDAQSNQLTSLNVTGCTALEILYAHLNQLTTLDVSGLTSLQGLYAQYNNLTSLRMANCPALYMLPMYYNQIKAGQMSQAVNDLPTRSADNRGSIYVYAPEHPETGQVDGNIMTASQVAQAYAKYWDVMCWNWDINDWEPYGGSSNIMIGDVNGDGNINISDVTLLINIVLNGGLVADYEAGDVNGDGNINISDITLLINMVLNGGQAAMSHKAAAPATGAAGDMMTEMKIKDNQVILREKREGCTIVPDSHFSSLIP